MSGALPFVGWLRDAEGDGGPWVEACRHETERGCWRLLIPMDGLRHCEKLVTDSGRHPDDRRRPR